MIQLVQQEFIMNDKKFAEITGSQAAKSDPQSMAASIDSGIRRKI